MLSKIIKFLTTLAMLSLLAVFGLIKLGNDSQTTRSPLKNSQSLPSFNTKVPPVTSVVLQQDSQGLTEQDLSEDVLENYSNFFIKIAKQKAKEHFEEQGFNPEELKINNDDIQTNYFYMYTDGKKLGVIRQKVRERVRTVHILGFAGDQFYRVSCMRLSHHDISLFQGECSEQIQNTFGVAFNPNQQ